MKQKILISWLPIGVVGTIILGAVYATVQQNYRQSANDPQIQLAEDGSALLAQGLSIPQLAAGMPRVDVTKSLSSFVMFFDENGKLILSSGYLGATSTSTPSLPIGVLNAARSANQNRVTWQLPTGERFASVVIHWKGQTQSGFLLVARSLREVENRELSLEMMIAVAWVVTMIATLAAVWGKYYLRNRV